MTSKGLFYNLWTKQNGVEQTIRKGVYGYKSN